MLYAGSPDTLRLFENRVQTRIFEYNIRLENTALMRSTVIINFHQILGSSDLR
jgi:hypothetical protein